MYVLSVLFLSLCLSQQTSEPSITKGNETNPQTETQAQKPNSDNDRLCTNCEINQEPQKTQQEKYDEASEKRLYRWYLWACIVGAFGSVVIVGILVWQNVLTRIAANAAKTSADSLKNIERPWLLITTLQHSSFPFGKERKNTSIATWFFKNHGRTPAYICEVAGQFTMVEKIADLPAEPIYRRAPTYSDYGVIAPQEESTAVHIPYDLILVAPDIWSKLKSDEARLITSGLIRYKDAFGYEHETRFCYLYDWASGQFNDMVGPESYNRHT